uniref:Angiopoietin-1 receptor n=1 Tax=Cacopsylla melanoneura TaxID=428564 RepID=A0A8D8YDM7_9HEMI
MYRFVILCFGLLVYIKQIRGDGNGITTVYKFRTLKSNTENVGLLDSFGLTSVSTHSENVKYLNTCSVSVHVENNPQRMPLFNIHGDSVLPNTTLPPLYSDQGLSTWQLILNNGTTRPLPAIHPFKIDLNNARDMAPGIINHTKAIMKDIMDTSDNDVVFEQRRVVRDEDLFKIIEKKPNTKTIVGVEFQAFTPIWVIISWSGSTFKYKSLQVTVNNNRDIFVCYQNSVYPKTNDDLYSMCSFAPQKYTLDEKNQARLDIDITNNIIVIDKVSSITHETQLTIPSDCDTYTIRHEYDSSSSTGEEVLYTLKQQTPITIVSPWIDMEYNPTMVILYSRPEGSNLSVCMESINTVQQTELVCEEQPQQNNIVLKQVNMTLAQDWIGRKRIKIIAGGGALVGNVWEGRHLDLYRVKEPQACVKSSMRDIYSIPHFEPHTIAQSDKVSHCFNGGRLENDFICSCPPGFVGHACQIPCGRNLFGQKCGKQCSRSPSACKGVVLCTPEYGCSCAPGYQGDYCSEQCQPGFYGADCKQ